MKKRCTYIICILSILTVLLSYICFFPDSGYSLFKVIPAIKSIDQLKEQNATLLTDIGKKDELIEKLELTQNENTSLKKRIGELLEMNMVVNINGYEMKLAGERDLSISLEKNAIMESRAIEFILAMFNNEMNNFKDLCTEDLYKELVKTDYIVDVNEMTESQNVFSEIKGKKIASFYQITPPFKNNNGYTVIVLFASNDFENGRYIHGVFNFIEYKGNLLISFFGRDI